MKTAFIVTSAINTRFGVFDPTARMLQTMDTIKSIKAKVPDAYIILLEMAGAPLLDDRKALLQKEVNLILDYSSDKIVQGIYENPNWDVVKSSTELMCFGNALRAIEPYVSKCDRIFKLSGRYVLNDNFDINNYTNNKIVFAKRRPSQFPSTVTGGVTEQYMSRCWSFPTTMYNDVYHQFLQMKEHMTKIVNAGGYIDIEHLLFKFTPPDRVLEIGTVGVEGRLGPNGVRIND